MKKKYIPDRGDIVFISLDPTLGHEQNGRRPAVILSRVRYNQLFGLCLVVPVTSKTKKYLFEASLGERHKIKGYVLTDQIKNISWTERKVEFVEKIEEELLQDICAKIKAFLE